MAALVNRFEKVAAARAGDVGVTKFIFTEDEDATGEE
jgi:hypothetical protein